MAYISKISAIVEDSLTSNVVLLGGLMLILVLYLKQSNGNV